MLWVYQNLKLVGLFKKKKGGGVSDGSSSSNNHDSSAEFERLKRELEQQKKHIAELTHQLQQGNYVPGDTVDDEVKKLVVALKEYQDSFGADKIAVTWRNDPLVKLLDTMFEAEDALYFMSELQKWIVESQAGGRHEEYNKALGKLVQVIYTSQNEHIKRIIKNEEERRIKLNRDALFAHAEQFYNQIKAAATLDVMVGDLATYPPHVQFFHIQGSAIRSNIKLMRALKANAKFLTEKQYLAFIYYLGKKVQGLKYVSSEEQQSAKKIAYEFFDAVEVKFDGNGAFDRVEFKPGKLVAGYNAASADIQNLVVLIQNGYANLFYDWSGVLSQAKRKYKGDYDAAVIAVGTPANLETRPFLRLLFKDPATLRGVDNRPAIDSLISKDKLDATSKADLKAVVYNLLTKIQIDDLHKNLKYLVKNLLTTIKERAEVAANGSANFVKNDIEARVKILGGGVFPAIEGGVVHGGGHAVQFDYAAATTPREGFAVDYGLVNKVTYLTGPAKEEAPLLKLLGKNIKDIAKFSGLNTQHGKTVMPLSTTQELKAIYYHLTSDQVVFDGNEDLRDFVKVLGEKITQRAADNTREEVSPGIVLSIASRSVTSGL